VSTAKFADLLAAEWIKLRTLRSLPWLVGITVLLICYFDIAGTLQDKWDFKNWSAQQQHYFMHNREGAYAHIGSRSASEFAELLLGVLGAVAFLSEQTTGQFRATFTAAPARREVLAAKTLTVAALATAFGTLMTLIGFFADESILGNSYAAVGLGDRHVLRILLGTIVYAPVSALIGLALAALLRTAIPVMVGLFVIQSIIPMLFRPDHHLQASIVHAMPFEAWYTLSLPNGINGDQFPTTVGGSWAVFGCWAAAATALSVLLIARRDQ
jgi:hypothetical protein